MSTKDEMPSASKDFWNASLYDKGHSFVWEFATDLIKLLDPKPGERILDLGCGTGHLTNQISESGAETLGIDNSASMISQAKNNYPHVAFDLADARTLHYSQHFDAVFSNATIHWITEPAKVVSSIWKALKPNGRFVAEFGGKGNIRYITDALQKALDTLGNPDTHGRHPWYFPSLSEYATLVQDNGFRVTHKLIFERPTPLEAGENGLSNWIAMFGETFLTGLTTPQRQEVVSTVIEQLRPKLFRNGSWVADYVRLRIMCVKDAYHQPKS